MELQEIKEIWRQYDEKLDKQVQVNMHLLRKIELDKTRSALRKLMVGPILLIVTGTFMQVVLGPFIFHHLALPQFAAPAILLELFAISMIVTSSLQLSIVAKIDYDAPIAEIQQTVEKLRVHRVYGTTMYKLSSPLLWLPALIVGLKGVTDFDFYAHFDHAWIASNIAFGLALIVLGIWLARRYVDQEIAWPWLKNLMEDIAGRNLAKARASLKEIEDFAREN